MTELAGKAASPMDAASVDAPQEARLTDGWWPCCAHCGCGTPDGFWLTREGHDDTCKEGYDDA